ncbi:hypothetical protein JZO70_04610 [Enterococcus sp. 669A]|uniref:Gram-positive cocci surface proteins LPxTG domain-containing protein n=1 Tax=Candidatus Enterococcus moelleringii TaxID=2815325 RepID=A0ABS3L729_9ENTE|nr:hypothetical protein [Enterococcus sp. 669A]MBO1305428.1 hypothetical protein [Enterococcus sp. 669A]
MKKLVSVVLAVMAVLLLAVPSANADGAITADEQRILTEMDKGVTVSGKNFGFAASDRAQAENYLKQHDVSTANVDAVVGYIQQARSIAAAQNVNVANINSLPELIKAFPRDVINQLKNIVTSAAHVLGLSVTFSPGSVTITEPAGNNGSTTTTKAKTNTVYASGSAVKQTGANYAVSFASFGSLLVAAAGAFYVSKKRVA